MIDLSNRTRWTASVASLAVAALLAAGCGASTTGGAPAPEATPARFSYQPFSVRYVASSHGRVEQEFGGRVNASEFTLRVYLTAASVASGTAQRISITVDSIPVAEGEGTSREEAAGAAGSTFTGILSPEGQVVGFGGGDTTNALVQQLKTSLEQFLPRIPPEGASAGLTWSDTSEMSTSSSGLDIQVESVSRHEAQDWVDYAGMRALHILTVAQYALSGGGSQMGAEITIDGSGIRHEHRYLGANGAYLGGTSADTSNATAMVPAMGASIPITQTRYDTLTVIR